MKIARYALPILLTACLSTASWGDVYVKNKLFQGGVSGSGAAVMVEAEPMLKSLGVTGYTMEGDKLIIGEKSLTLASGMVALKDLADATGAKMVLNASLGTIDVYQNADKPIVETPAPAARPTATAAAPVVANPTWNTTWDAAVAESKRTSKPILLNFTGSDWCGWCIKLKEEVFETPAFKAWAAKKVVLLEVDFPRHSPQPDNVKARNQELAQKFGVSGYPSIFFSNSKGEPLGPRFGYAEGGPEAWTKQAEQVMKGK